MSKTKFSIMIITARQSKGYTLRDVELKARGKISNGYVSQLETGKCPEPTPPKLRVLCRVLNLDYMSVMKVLGYL